jgi:hypothetical protein
MRWLGGAVAISPGADWSSQDAHEPVQHRRRNLSRGTIIMLHHSLEYVRALFDETQGDWRVAQ